MWRWIVVALIALHGAAHAIGVMGSLLGRELEGVTGRPTIDVGGYERAFAALWLVALVAFAASATGLAGGQLWWRPMALGAIVASSIAVIVWWDDAWRGAIPNLLILVALAAASRLPGLLPD